MSKAIERKKQLVTELKKRIQNSPVIALANMENLPASQLQKIRAGLRESADIFMTKKKIMKRAFQETEQAKKGIAQMESHIKGMPALIFTKNSPFKLANILRKSKTKAPIKAGQAAPEDIIIPEGPTGFGPGPIISELSQAGLKTKIDQGKIVIVAETTIAKAGEIVSQKKAGVLAKLGIQPMEVGISLIAAYENGLIYGKDVLSINPQEFLDNLKIAAANANALTLSISYPTKDNITMLIAKAERQAKAVAGKQPQITDGRQRTADSRTTNYKPQAEIAEAEKQAEAIKEIIETKQEQKEERAAEIKHAAPAQKTAEKPKGKKPDFQRIKNVISEEFKEDIQKEKEKRENFDMKGAENLAQQLIKRGTLRQ